MRSQGALSLVMILTVAYFFSPVIFGGYLYYQLQMGAFPAESDAIAIPFMEFIVLWFAGLAVAAIAAITPAFMKVFRSYD